MKDIYMSSEIFKLPQENAEEMLADIGRGKDFFPLNLTLKSTGNECQNKQKGYILTKELCREENNRVKRQPREWAKIFASYVSDKEVMIRLSETTQKQKTTQLKHRQPS